MKLRNIAILTLLLLILILAIWRPWTSHSPDKLGLTAEQISPVVVLPFETSRVEDDWQWLSTALVDLFATKLNLLPPLRAVSLEQLLEWVSPLSLRGGLELTPEETIDHFGAATALTGTLSHLDRGFRLEIRLIGKRGTGFFRKDHADGADWQALFAAVDSLSLRLAGALDWETLPQAPPIAEMTTSSVPAYHHYVMAVEDYIISDDNSLPRAADHLRLAAAADSTFARAHFLRAKVCDQAQALDIPMEYAEEALIGANAFPQRLPEWEAEYARGWLQWLVQGNLDGAVMTLTELTQKYQDYAWQEGVPLTLSRLLAHQGRWPEAVEQLKTYVLAEETPTLRRALGWGQLALAYELIGDLDGAIEAAESELSLVGERQKNHYWWIGEMTALSLLYFERGDVEAAEDFLVRVQEDTADDARGVAMIGLTRFRMQQVNLAQTLAERALRLNGDLASGHYLRGLLALKRKNYWRAVADLEAAASQEFDWDYLYHAAIAHTKRGDDESARELLQLLVDILSGEAPDDVEPQDQGTLGILLSRMGRGDEALFCGSEATKNYPYPQAKYDLACICAIGEDKAQALKWLRAAFDDGYLRRRQARADFDLENLWYDPDFILLTSGR